MYQTRRYTEIRGGELLKKCRDDNLEIECLSLKNTIHKAVTKVLGKTKEAGVKLYFVSEYK